MVGRVGRGHGSHTDLVADPQPHACDARAGAPRQDLGHPRQHVLRRVRLADAFAELRQDLVRRCPPPVDEAVPDPPRETDDGDEEHAEQHSGDPGLRGVAAPDRQDAEDAHRRDRDQRQQDGDRDGDRRLLDHDVELPQAVPEDRHEVRSRDPEDDREHREPEHDREDRRPGARLLEGGEEDLQRDEKEQQQDERAGDRGHEDQPAHLLSFLAGRALEPLAHGDDRGEGGGERDDGTQGDDHAAYPGERVDPERVRVQDPVISPVVERARPEQEPQEHKARSADQPDHRPPPSAARRVPVWVQQEQQRYEGDRIQGQLPEGCPGPEERHREALGLHAVGDDRLRQGEQRQRCSGDDEQPPRPVRRLAGHDEHPHPEPHELEEDDSHEHREGATARRHEVSLCDPPPELLQHLLHPGGRRVAHQDDRARRNPVAHHAVDDAPRDDRRHAQHQDAGRDRPGYRAAHAVTSIGQTGARPPYLGRRAHARILALRPSARKGAGRTAGRSSTTPAGVQAPPPGRAALTPNRGGHRMGTGGPLAYRRGMSERRSR